MHTTRPSTRLMRQFVHDSTFRTCQITLARRGLHIRPPPPPPSSVRTSALAASARRTFTSSLVSRASLASHPPGEPTELVVYPTEDALKALEDEDSEDPEVDLVPPEEATLEMTERAAEQLRHIAQREANPSAALRIAVESGGCHGYQYKMQLEKGTKPDDYLFSHPQVKPSNIVIDAVSMGLMKGSVIDYATELIGSSFRVVENPQAKGSGCGCGVSWELKEV